MEVYLAEPWDNFSYQHLIEALGQVHHFNFLRNPEEENPLKQDWGPEAVKALNVLFLAAVIWVNQSSLKRSYSSFLYVVFCFFFQSVLLTYQSWNKRAKNIELSDWEVFFLLFACLCMHLCLSVSFSPCSLLSVCVCLWFFRSSHVPIVGLNLPLKLRIELLISVPLTARWWDYSYIATMPTFNIDDLWFL